MVTTVSYTTCKSEKFLTGEVKKLVKQTICLKDTVYDNHVLSQDGIQRRHTLLCLRRVHV